MPSEWLAVIDSLATGLAVLTEAHVVAVWNDTLAAMVEVSRHDIVGKPFPLPLGSGYDPAEHQLPDGRWLEISARPFAGGKVVTVSDITRRRAVESAKTLFMASTSHELKTPLTVIRSFAEWLLGKGALADPERQRQALEAIVNGAEELRQLVEKVLLTARTEAGAVELSIETLDPIRLVHAVADQFSVVRDTEGVQVELPTWLPEVRADRQAVRTALGQLLENAFKYSPDGGHVRISAELTDGGDAVEISVSDEGIGLQPGEAEFLFVAFYQGETGQKAGVRGGVGLGLSIVRRLVESMGGTVGAEGVAGAGSRFWFTLPTVTL
jgi:signal transduction histidine kinase